METAGSFRDSKMFCVCWISWPHLGKPDDDHQVYDHLCKAVHRIIDEDMEGNFDSFALTDAEVPVVAPAMDAEVVDLALGGLDEDEGLMGKEHCDIPTVTQTQESLCLQQNKVECMGSDHDLMQYLKKKKNGAGITRTWQYNTQLTAFLAPQ